MFLIVKNVRLDNWLLLETPVSVTNVKLEKNVKVLPVNVLIV
jgi:hypothetical protein